MEHFIGISFLIATFFICLQARTIPSSDASVPQMRRHVECDNGSLFYTPNVTNYECIASAMECFKNELNGTVKAECNGTMMYVDQAVGFFKRKLNQNPPAQTNPTECACERMPEKPFGEFLDGVDLLLAFELSAAATHVSSK